MIEGDYAIIKTAEEAILFLGTTLDFPDDELRLYPARLCKVFIANLRTRGTEEICVESSDCDGSLEEMKPMATRAQVLEAITPKEGDAIFWWETYDGHTQHELDDPPQYETCYQIEYLMAMGCEIEDSVKANALTIGKTIGKLRELIAWARP